MFRYIFRDVKNALKQKYSLYYVVAFLLLCLLANFSMICFRRFYGMNDGSFGENLIIFSTQIFWLPYYSTVFIANIIFGVNYPDPHLKDGVTRRMSRYQVYLSKLIGAIVLGCAFFIAAIAIFFAVTLVFQFKDGTIEPATLIDFLNCARIAVPLWIAGLSIANMFFFIFPDKRKAYAGFFTVCLVVPRLIMFLASDAIRIPVFGAICKILITPEFSALPYFFTQDPVKDLILGAVYTVISSVIGISFYYRRK